MVLQFISLKFYFLFVIIYLCSSINLTSARQRKPVLHSDVIEEVDVKKLEQLIQDTEYIAVFFCKKIIIIIINLT